MPVRLRHVLCVCFALVLGIASAGEVYVGSIVSADGGAWDNRYSTDAGFDIRHPGAASLQCTVPMYVCTDRARSTGGGATTGVVLPAGIILRTSVEATTNTTYPWTFDAGAAVGIDSGVYVISGGVISILPVTASTNAACKVFRRSGQE